MKERKLATTTAQRRASLKWERKNNEKITVKLRREVDPSKAQLEAAARASGQSVNAWIIDAIKDKL
ncbi:MULTISPECIES: hypothetical protein [unclassified Oscillibacter]|uniref:hypothetical protein n=1 Tax=unclassified Oscillibacter TaxID=2629304 RepID=UPI0025E68314|nr:MULTISPECIES: hypothetical protein [unclassified Oscillibacter]